jgi:riboflavin biosynthesis pyrimidine reductase
MEDSVRFSKLPVPIEEMEKFYSVHKMPHNRPYTWYMFVMSADGIGSLVEKAYHDTGIGLSGPGIALKHFRDSRPEAIGAYVDWRLLQYGWAVADAVASGSNVLKAEPELLWLPFDGDLLDYRQALGKEAPLRVLITGNGFSSEELSYPVFRPDGRFNTLIATSEKGYQRMQRELEHVKGPEPTAEIKAFGSERVDFEELVRVLHREYAVKHLDLQGGPDISGQFFKKKLVDEYRLTLSPTIVGGINSEGLPRPGPVKTSYGPEDLITMNLIKEGTYGSHKFLRYEVKYGV